jgi:hypothetical protein
MSIQEKAFPNPHLTHETGMTIRDYFAAKAMQVVNENFAPNYDEQEGYRRCAQTSYLLADAMMEARNAK